MGSKGDVKEFFGMGVSEPDQSSVCFLWVPKVTWKSFLACVLRGVCSHRAGVRVFRNRTCWCSGVSEPDQSIVFYGFQRWRERVFWHAFCLACPASVRVFRNRTNSGVSEPYQSIVFYCFLWVPKVTWKSFLALFRGLVFGQVGLESCWGLAVSAPCRTEAGAATEGAIAACSSIHSSIHYMVFAWFFHAFEAACLVMSGIGVGLLHLSCGRQKATLGSFSGAGFWTGWAWILLGFGCFGSVPNGGRSCHRSCHCSSIHSSIHYMVFALLLFKSFAWAKHCFL